MFDGMRIGLDEATQIIELLCEGMSVSATARITRTDAHTVIDLLRLVGDRCTSFLQEQIRGVCADDIQVDEIWQFVFCKKATADRERYVGGCGDSYCFTAIERDTKLMLAWHLGRRDRQHTDVFCAKLRNAVAGRVQVTSDGFQPYPAAMAKHLGGRIDFAQLIKSFGEAPKEDRRKYSPAKIIGIRKKRHLGNPDMDRVCTSHCERLNGSIRNFVKRMGRLTYCFSKRWENHRAALGLFFAHYNFCRKHRTLKGETPAMAHGIADHVWTVRELLTQLNHG